MFLKVSSFGMVFESAYYLASESALRSVSVCMTASVSGYMLG